MSKPIVYQNDVPDDLVESVNLRMIERALRQRRFAVEKTSTEVAALLGQSVEDVRQQALDIIRTESTQPTWIVTFHKEPTEDFKAALLASTFSTEPQDIEVMSYSVAVCSTADAISMICEASIHVSMTADFEEATADYERLVSETGTSSLTEMRRAGHPEVVDAYVCMTITNDYLAMTVQPFFADSNDMSEWFLGDPMTWHLKMDNAPLDADWLSEAGGIAQMLNGPFIGLVATGQHLSDLAANPSAIAPPEEIPPIVAMYALMKEAGFTATRIGEVLFEVKAGKSTANDTMTLDGNWLIEEPDADLLDVVPGLESS